MNPEPTILHEDGAILVIAKPAGLAVHPPSSEAPKGQLPRARDLTVVDWLTNRYSNLETDFPRIVGEIWRPGIVHRLDRDTSGVMVIAKTAEALTNLQDQFRSRTTEKVYRALVAGVPDETGELSGSIARSDADPTHQQIRRLSFSWSKGTARAAETTCRRLATTQIQPSRLDLKRHPNPTLKVGSDTVSLVELRPKTGRMHQLRVQLPEAGWPILGDEKYGTKRSQRLSAEFGVHRQLLHALRLTFNHPTTGERMSACAPYPDDFIDALRRLDLPIDSC